MKKLAILTAVICFFALSSFAAGPNEKVLKVFSKTFVQAEGVSWLELSDFYEVTFRQNNTQMRIVFDSDGNILKSIRYYGGDMLPIFIQGKLSKKYADKKVFGVTEVTTADQVTYQIVLEDSKTFTHVRSDAFGNMEVEKSFNKS